MLQLRITFTEESINDGNSQLESMIKGCIIDRKQLVEVQLRLDIGLTRKRESAMDFDTLKEKL